MAKVLNIDEFSKPMKVRRPLMVPHEQVETGKAREEEFGKKRK